MPRGKKEYPQLTDDSDRMSPEAQAQALARQARNEERRQRRESLRRQRAGTFRTRAERAGEYDVHAEGNWPADERGLEGQEYDAISVDELQNWGAPPIIDRIAQAAPRDNRINSSLRFDAAFSITRPEPEEAARTMSSDEWNDYMNNVLVNLENITSAATEAYNAIAEYFDIPGGWDGVYHEPTALALPEQLVLEIVPYTNIQAHRWYVREWSGLILGSWDEIETDVRQWETPEVMYEYRQARLAEVLRHAIRERRTNSSGTTAVMESNPQATEGVE